MINGSPHTIYNDDFDIPYCNHRGRARLTGYNMLILRCYECNRWCSTPANWFAIPNGGFHIDS